MHALALIGISVLLLASLAYAENDSLGDLFPNDDSGITPPSLGTEIADGEETPQEAPTNAFEEMAAADTAGAKSLGETFDADSSGNLTLTIKDVDTGSLITNAHIRMFLTQNGNTLDTLRFVGEDGKMQLQLSPGLWDITLKLDITSTVGKDYFSRLSVIVNGNTTDTAFMQPVGSLMGEVYDSSNSLVPGATIKFECQGDYGVTGDMTSDQFGSFSAEWLPIGSCKVSALKGERVGSQTVQIAQGQLSEARLMLEQKVITEPDYSRLIIIVVIVVIAAAVFFFLRKRSRPIVIEESKEITPDKHMNDILSALDETEKSIMENLLQMGGKSLQSKIGRELSLPKSSLSRAIGGLEARNIVKTEKLGRIKRVELSEWFLNGKKP